MKTKSIKKAVAVALATTMVCGSAITAHAAGTDGTGSYEGGEMKYPVLSVTLPTVPSGAYDYIADPNGLIAATAAAKYDGATFTGTTGVFFKTTDADGDTKATYTNKSKALEVANENAQDVDITIKLEQKTAGSKGIAYSDAAAFEAEDKDQKLYLAVTNGLTDDAEKTIAMSAETPAVLTTMVAGTKTNYKANWDSSDGYGYVLDESKKSGDKYTWNSCSYALTGALNTNAEWADDVTFPVITVTWSFKEHEDITFTDLTAYSDWFGGATLWIAVDASNGFAAAPSAVEVSYDGGAYKAITNQVNAANWVQVDYSDIDAAKSAGATKYTIRVTVGTERYTTAEISL